MQIVNWTTPAKSLFVLLRSLFPIKLVSTSLRSNASAASPSRHSDDAQNAEFKANFHSHEAAPNAAENGEYYPNYQTTRLRVGTHHIPSNEGRRAKEPEGSTVAE